MLESLLDIRGVRRAALVDASGTVLGQVGGAPDVQLVATGRAVAGSLISALGSGELKDMLIEFEDGPVLLTSLGGRTLITSFDDVTSLGRVRFALKKLMPSLAG